MSKMQSMSGTNFESWGRFPKVDQKALSPHWRNDVLSYFKNGHSFGRDDKSTVLPFGQGRSYGDVCLNDGGSILSSQNLKNFISSNN